MIAVDTSVMVAILLQEDDAKPLLSRLLAAQRAIIGTPTLLETRMVLLPRLGTTAIEIVDQTAAELCIQSIDFTAAHLAAATDAFDRYGKGRHRASLNYGDCMAYAVAKAANCPLLYKGDDFAQTDIRSAL